MNDSEFERAVRSAREQLTGNVAQCAQRLRPFASDRLRRLIDAGILSGEAELAARQILSERGQHPDRRHE
jgi:hypothetical protein